MRDIAKEKEDAQAQLQALTGLDDDSIAWLTEQAEQLSTSMTDGGLRIRQSATEILQAYQLVGGAKPELLENKEALNQVTVETMRLATASGMDLRQAVDGVTLAMNQYGAAADEVSRYVNTLAAGAKFGSAEVDSVTQAVRRAGVAASAADIPIESLVGARGDAPVGRRAANGTRQPARQGTRRYRHTKDVRPRDLHRRTGHDRRGGQGQVLHRGRHRHDGSRRASRSKQRHGGGKGGTGIQQDARARRGARHTPHTWQVLSCRPNYG